MVFIPYFTANDPAESKFASLKNVEAKPFVRFFRMLSWAWNSLDGIVFGWFIARASSSLLRASAVKDLAGLWRATNRLEIVEKKILG